MGSSANNTYRRIADRFGKSNSAETQSLGASLNYTFGLDVGGTKISAVVLDDTGIVREHYVVPTQEPGIPVVRQIEKLVAAAADEHDLLGVGVAVPGDVDPDRGVVRCAPNIGWRHVDLRKSLRHLIPLNKPLVTHNDANAAVWAEYRFGGHSQGNSFAMFTVGTGIGGGFVLNGQLVVGATGAAGEVGHISLIPDGEPCACGTRGCWERYASGTALQAAARANGWTSTNPSHDVLASASTNKEAKAVVAGVAQHLVRGIGIVSAALDPSDVVLGGGLGSDPRFLAIVGEVYKELTITPPRSRPNIIAATLGPLAGAIGAADLAHQQPAVLGHEG
jgi:glucokinase